MSVFRPITYIKFFCKTKVLFKKKIRWVYNILHYIKSFEIVNYIKTIALLEVQINQTKKCTGNSELCKVQ